MESIWAHFDQNISSADNRPQKRNAQRDPPSLPSMALGPPRCALAGVLPAFSFSRTVARLLMSQQNKWMALC